MGRRELTINSQPGENDELVVSVSDTGVGIPPLRRTKSSTRSLPPSLMALAWDFGSAGRSWNRMAAAFGLPTTHPRGATFHLTLPNQIDVHE